MGRTDGMITPRLYVSTVRNINEGYEAITTDYATSFRPSTAKTVIAPDPSYDAFGETTDAIK